MRISEIIGEPEGFVRKDADDEDDRVFLVYCRKHRIKISDLNNQELSHHYANAIVNRSRYPIPVSGLAFYYHGTVRTKLPEISQHGLIPSEKANTRHFYAITANSLRRVFFTDTIRNATFYAIRARHGRQAIALLRVRRDALKDAQPDTEDESSVFVERIVPANDIEVWNGKMWANLISGSRS